MIVQDLEEVHVTHLEGLGSSYRMKGFFTLKVSNKDELKINFEGVAFGGNYGGHNVSVSLSDEEKENIIREKKSTESEIEDLLSEVQRKMLNNELIVDYENIKPEEHADGLAGI
ncbi:MAG: hypothetical protein OK439_05295 [Thaumarchaeota archaeon]|nr:hypothetical protein [Nitrososphaerota archaeon]